MYIFYDALMYYLLYILSATVRVNYLFRMHICRVYVSLHP